MVNSDRKPFEYEYCVLRCAARDFLDIYSGGRLGANRCRPGVSKNTDGSFNIFGCLVTKRKRGCSYFYGLLNVHAKKDGWTRCGVKLEDDLYNEGIDWEYDEDRILCIVKQVFKTPYLNRLKQFYLRLLRNNLFLGNRNQKSSTSDPNLCFMCGKHPERRVPLLYSCEVVKRLTYRLIDVLSRANLLGKGVNKLGIG